MMDLEIITPDQKLFSGKARAITVPGSKGSFTILRNHAPIISTLDKGKIRVFTVDFVDKFFDVEGGIIEVVKNKIIILAEPSY